MVLRLKHTVLKKIIPNRKPLTLLEDEKNPILMPEHNAKCVQYFECPYNVDRSYTLVVNTFYTTAQGPELF